MATIFVNGVFDILHEGHQRFLGAARLLGTDHNFGLTKEASTCTSNVLMIARSMMANLPTRNRLVIAVNSDDYARSLKAHKWGEKYPIDNLETRMEKLRQYADEVVSFDNEYELWNMIRGELPCILCKGPDYIGKRVTGQDIAPVIILDTPEPESVKQMKIRVYGQAPGAKTTLGT